MSVHVEDPGQVLAMVPVVSLFGGYLVERALDTTDLWISRWHALTVFLATVLTALIAGSGRGWLVLLCAPPIALATGLLLRVAKVKNSGNPPRLAMLAFLMAPALVVNLTAFNARGWYYKGASEGLDQVVADINTGLELTSREAVERTLATDDHTLRQLQRLAAERPGQTVVLFEEGMTTWRKATYYAPAVPMIVLEHKRIRSSNPAMAVWKGNRQEAFSSGAAPQRVALPKGARIVWLLNPRTEFYSLVQQAFAPASADPVCFTDLPAGSGSRRLGEYELAW